MKVIDRRHLPAHLPVIGTLVMYLVLDKFEAAGWVWGAVGLLYLFVWVNSIYRIITDESVNLFVEKNDE